MNFYSNPLSSGASSFHIGIGFGATFASYSLHGLSELTSSSA